MLQINTQAPNFTLPDSSNVQHSLSDYLGKKVVLYFYPKDNTGGCTKQALNYKEMLPQIIDNNAIVIGISKDSPSSHQKFETKYGKPTTTQARGILDRIIAGLENKEQY